MLFIEEGFVFCFVFKKNFFLERKKEIRPLEAYYKGLATGVRLPALARSASFSGKACK